MRPLIALLVMGLLSAAEGGPRSSAVKAEFRRANPCPATGKVRGGCPGYVIDHVRPLCAGGADHPRNLQWQSRADAIRKDRAEHAECRALRRATP